MLGVAAGRGRLLFFANAKKRTSSVETDFRDKLELNFSFVS